MRKSPNLPMSAATPRAILTPSSITQDGDQRPSPIAQGVEQRLGTFALLGRFHRPPKSIEDDYLLTETVLGRGCSGSVKLAYGRSLPDPFAVKRLPLEGVSKETRVRLETEVQICLCMDHPHITRLVDVYESESQLDLVMECMHGGELFARVKSTRFMEEEAAQVTQQMLLALNYLHSFGVVHRDLKLENFIYDSQLSGHLKLIDFGFSKFRTKGQRMKTNCGTLAYTAPEVLAPSTERSYTSQCDLWSLGVIVYILLANNMPFFGSAEEMQEKILRAEYEMDPKIWSKLSDDACSFVRSLLQVDPGARLTAKTALAHPWLAQHCHSASPAWVDPSVVTALKAYAQAPKFQRCCRSLLAWMVSNNDHAKVREIFKTIDTDNDGTIRLSDLQQVMVEGYHMSESEVRQIFDALDTNHQNEIRYSDFLAAMLYHEYALHEDVLRAAFKKFDVADSGKIGAEELRRIVGDSFEGEAVEALICEADSNNDGLISYDDFESCIRGSSPLATPRNQTPDWGNISPPSCKSHGHQANLRSSMRGGTPLSTPRDDFAPNFGNITPLSCQSKCGQQRNLQFDRTLAKIPVQECSDEFFPISREELVALTSLNLRQSPVKGKHETPNKQYRSSLSSAQGVHAQPCCGIM